MMKIRGEKSQLPQSLGQLKDPTPELLKAVRASFEQLKTQRDPAVANVDQNAVTQAELDHLLATTTQVLADLRAELKQRGSAENLETLKLLEGVSAESLLARVLGETPELAHSLTKAAASALAEKLNTHDSFKGIAKSGVLHGTTLQVPLDLNQDGQLEVGKDVVVDYPAVGGLQAHPGVNADRINHWYDSQPGRLVHVKGSASEVQVLDTQAQQRAQRQAKLEAEQKARQAKLELDKRIKAAPKEFAAALTQRKAEWMTKLFGDHSRGIEGDSGKFRTWLFNLGKPLGMDEQTMLDVALPHILGDDALAGQLDFLKARMLTSGSSTPAKQTVYVEDGGSRFGVVDIGGRAYFRISEGQLPEGLTQGMAIGKLPAHLQAQLAEGH